ncbi:MAG: hypothetical protein KC635_13565 [Myxococcales bacterium]|nr:hypothetical protein [Myxococcales bacterium]MCB9736393.1 hypothetical protein [Deltaproteobacteria bacterium]
MGKRKSKAQDAPAPREATGLFRQVVVVAVQGIGAGAQDDAGEYKDLGADTLAHVATYMGGLELRLLQWLGLGNVTRIRGVAPAEPPAASHGLARRASAGRDPAGALGELVGDAIRTLHAAGVPIHAVGAAADLLDGVDGVTRHDHAGEGPLVALTRVAGGPGRDGLVIAAPVAGETMHGAVGPVGIARALARLDAALGALLDQLGEDSLLVITALGGRDATLPGREGGTRERAPLLVYTPALPSGVDLGTRLGLADVGATVAHVLGDATTAAGTSFYEALLA